MPFIDLRSDTVTKPTPEMRKFMANAEVGDDIYGEDPTVIELQEEVADLLGKEAALYCPSGCMTNQIALNILTEEGDEVILEEHAHIYNYETAAPSILSRVQLHTVRAADNGVLSVDEVRDAIREDAYYMPISRLLIIENTLNRAGGRIYPLQRVKELSEFARSRGLYRHLDGARLWNACVATGATPEQYAEHFETVSVCFSKGLGAPVGSAICGSKELITKARKIRKIWGGGMRQAGIIAAGALYAMRNNRERLTEDHVKAKLIAEIVADGAKGIKVHPGEVETNIILMEVGSFEGVTKAVSELKEHGVLISRGNNTSIRAVTHLDVSHTDCERAGHIIADYFKN
jgi:threonine aldolase